MNSSCSISHLQQKQLKIGTAKTTIDKAAMQLSSIRNNSCSRSSDWQNTLILSDGSTTENFENLSELRGITNSASSNNNSKHANSSSGSDEMMDITTKFAVALKSSALWAESLRRAEDQLRKLAGVCQLQKTGHPTVFCSTLPRHWRSNKSLPTPFVVAALHPISDGTRVIVAAGNDENPTADVKNGAAEFCAQVARFSDLRFVGKSGRGKNFNLTITIYTKPSIEVAIVSNAIKVTVDGPRDSRNNNNNNRVNGQISHIARKRTIRSLSPTTTLDNSSDGGGEATRNNNDNSENETMTMTVQKKPRADKNLITTANNNGSSSNNNKVENSSLKFDSRLTSFQWRKRRAARKCRSETKCAQNNSAQTQQSDNTVNTTNATALNNNAAFTLYNSVMVAAAFGASLRQQKQQQQLQQLQQQPQLKNFDTCTNASAFILPLQPLLANSPQENFGAHNFPPHISARFSAQKLCVPSPFAPATVVAKQQNALTELLAATGTTAATKIANFESPVVTVASQAQNFQRYNPSTPFHHYAQKANLMATTTTTNPLLLYQLLFSQLRKQQQGGNERRHEQQQQEIHYIQQNALWKQLQQQQQQEKQQKGEEQQKQQESQKMLLNELRKAAAINSGEYSSATALLFESIAEANFKKNDNKSTATNLLLPPTNNEIKVQPAQKNKDDALANFSTPQKAPNLLVQSCAKTTSERWKFRSLQTASEGFKNAASVSESDKIKSEASANINKSEPDAENLKKNEKLSEERLQLKKNQRAEEDQNITVDVKMRNRGNDGSSCIRNRKLRSSCLEDCSDNISSDVSAAENVAKGDSYLMPKATQRQKQKLAGKSPHLWRPFDAAD